MSLFIVGMDNTIVNVALPSIGRQWGASMSDLQWTVDAYTVVLASLLILSGSTGDRLGRRRTFQTGLVLFVLGSLACSLAPGLGALVAFRALQAIGGSMLNPVALSIITNVFPNPRERAQAIGVWGGVIGISMGLGPVIGGLLTESVTWRAIFWINVPIGVAAIVLTALFVPESRAPRGRRPDPVGQLLMIVMLLSLTYAIIEAPRSGVGWLSVQTWSLFAVVALAMAGFVWYEPRRTDPLIDLRFFRSASFTGATLVAVCAFVASGGLLFVSTVYLQLSRGLSPLRAGLFIVPEALMIAVLAPISGRLVATRGARLPMSVAGLAMAFSALLLTGWTEHTSYAYLLITFVIFGAAFGLVNAPLTNAAVAGMPRSQGGVAAAVASTSRQVGASLGVAIAGSLINSRLRGPMTVGLASASRPVWWLIVGCGLAIFVIALLTTGAWARRTAARAADLFEHDSERAAAVHAIR